MINTDAPSRGDLFKSGMQRESALRQNERLVAELVLVKQELSEVRAELRALTELLTAKRAKKPE